MINNRILIYIVILFILGLGISDIVSAQSMILELDQSRYVWRVDGTDLGEVDYDNYEHCGRFPNGSHYMYGISNIKEAYLFGHIILGDGQEEREYRKKGGSGYYQSSPFGIWVIYKYPPPKVYVNGIESSIPLESEGEVQRMVDPTIKADKMYRVYKKHSPWMHHKHEVYQFVNQYYGDFVIRKSTYKLTFDDDYYENTDPDIDADTSQTVEDFYILKAYRLSTASLSGKSGMDPNGKWFIHHGAWWESTMKVPSIVTGCDRNELILSYGWDGDHPNMTTFTPGGPLFDDTGEPRFKPVADGNLLSTQYAGFTLLHCDKSPSDKSDDIINNPYTSRVRTSYINYRGDAQWPGNKKTWDYFIPPGPGIYEVSSLEDGTDTNPTTIEGKQPVQIWGGWDWEMGDSVTVVHTIGAGSIDREEARAVGGAWANWYQFGDVTDAYYEDVQLGNVLVTDDIKNQIVTRGKDSLKVAMQRAQELWENDLECPHPYPSPDLYLTSGPYSVTLEWDDVQEKYSDHDGGNVIAYRIYRKKGHFEDEFPNEAGYDVFWEMIKELSGDNLIKSEKGLYTYVDAGLDVGEDYHYAVTAVSDKRCGIDGKGPYLESSQWTNRSLLPAVPIIPGKSHLDSIVVVPNPYYIQGQLMNYFGDDRNRLLFYNLPPFCKLKIYNITGDLIHTIIHDDGSSVASWDQITKFNQYIASGVYIAVVNNAQKLIPDDQGNLTVRKDLPDKAIVKFTIIR
jgi:hypothetical protein